MPVRIADGTTLIANYVGDVQMRLESADEDGKLVVVTFKNVYYHERFDANLMGWDRLRRDGWKLISNKDHTILKTPSGRRVKCDTDAGLIVIHDQTIEYAYGARGNVHVCTTAAEVVQMHRRLGHVSWRRLLQMSKVGSAIGIADFTSMPKAELEKAEEEVKTCAACCQGKQKANPLGTVSIKAQWRVR